MSVYGHLIRLALPAAALLLAACSNRSAPFEAAPAPAGETAVLYIYRPSASANFMMSPQVVIDGDEAFAIGNADYRYVYLRNGDHSIGLNSTDQYTTGPVLAITVGSGGSYYLRVGTSLTFEAQKMNTRKFWLDVVDEQVALTEIGATKYAGSRPGHTADSQLDTNDDEPGFSVDKTQDPFAGKYH